MSGNVTLLDGGMGQELIARSGHQPSGLWATEMMMKFPGLVREVHDAYFAAGAQVATTNTYAIHRDRMEHFGLPEKFEDLHALALAEAVAARAAHGSGLVAGSFGPLGWSYRPDMAPPATEAARLYAEIVALHDPHVDMFILETMSGVDQARGALMGCAETDKPVWLSLSVDDFDGTRLRSGEALEDALSLVDDFPVAALLVNCSRPEAVSQAMPIIARAGVPFGGYANGFTSITAAFRETAAQTDHLTARKDLGPAAYAKFVDAWIDGGASIVGGCCETGPAHIAEIARRLGARS